MIYAVYLAWHKNEIYSDEMISDPTVPDYPKEIARLRAYDNKGHQMEAYANTPCPASQLIEAETEDDLRNKVEEMGNNFLNREWLQENIYPFI